MTTHVSAEQVRHWIDDNAVREVTDHADEGVEFNFELQLSRLPIHVIKEEPWGPLRIVGKSAFDTDRARALLRDEEDRRTLLARIGPVLAGTPGFYTFLDAEGTACEFRNADTLQTEYRIYPDEASQQALMDGLMDVATGMRYVQNTIAVMLPNPEPTAEETATAPAGDGGAATSEAAAGDATSDAITDVDDDAPAAGPNEDGDDGRATESNEGAGGAEEAERDSDDGRADGEQGSDADEEEREADRDEGEGD